jgi:phosphoglucomutase/phosphomannomutase
MLLAELAGELKANGRTLHQELERLYRTVGYHEERTVARTYPGSAGMAQMQDIMSRLRSRPPATLAGFAVTQIRDIGKGLKIDSGGGVQPLPGPRSDLLLFDLAAEGNYVAVRPSGTEPKLKCYYFAYRSPQLSANLNTVQTEVRGQLDAMESDLGRLIV